MFDINMMMVTIEDYVLMILMLIINYLMEVLHEYRLLMYYYQLILNEEELEIK
jgi:hypothetical protein